MRFYLWGVNSSKSGDEFFEDLCDKHFNHVYKYCKYLVKGQNNLMDFVEECTQQTFLEARKQISKLINHPNPQGWLFTTARNLINNSYRNMYIRKRHEVFIDDYITNTLQSLENDFDQILDGRVEDVDTLANENYFAVTLL